jgi:hypothetical protein
MHRWRGRGSEFATWCDFKTLRDGMARLILVLSLPVPYQGARGVETNGAHSRKSLARRGACQVARGVLKSVD